MSQSTRGIVYRCPVCGSELVVLARVMGVFHPVCCNVDMQPIEQRSHFYVCPVCGAELAVVHPADIGAFEPHCCNVPMRPAA